MIMIKHNDDGDDGRTIADMSDIGHIGMGSSIRHFRKEFQNPEANNTSIDRPWEKQSVSNEERRWYIFGALKAALSIGLVYIIGLGLVILLLILAWS